MGKARGHRTHNGVANDALGFFDKLFGNGVPMKGPNIVIMLDARHYRDLLRGKIEI